MGELELGLWETKSKSPIFMPAQFLSLWGADRNCSHAALCGISFKGVHYRSFLIFQ